MVEEAALSADEIAHLDELTKPQLPFPQSLQLIVPGFLNGGTTINGVAGGPSMVIKPGVTPYERTRTHQPRMGHYSPIKQSK